MVYKNSAMIILCVTSVFAGAQDFSGIENIQSIEQFNRWLKQQAMSPREYAELGYQLIHANTKLNDKQKLDILRSLRKNALDETTEQILIILATPLGIAQFSDEKIDVNDTYISGAVNYGINPLKFFVRHGWSVKHPNRALFLAIGINKLDVAAYLLEQGADPEAFIDVESMRMRGPDDDEVVEDPGNNTIGHSIVAEALGLMDPRLDQKSINRKGLELLLNAGLNLNKVGTFQLELPNSPVQQGTILDYAEYNLKAIKEVPEVTNKRRIEIIKSLKKIIALLREKGAKRSTELMPESA